MRFLILIFLFGFSLNGQTQPFLENSKEFNKKRTIGVSILNASTWAGSIGGLYFVWYKDLPTTKFHFFNDAYEWQQMDKIGHLTTSWNFARTAGDLYKWSGVDSKKSALIGGGYAFAYMATFEMLDAYNESWGFSIPDLVANTTGAALYSTQAYIWDEQFVKPKFSAHGTDLAQYRPNLLGSGGVESLFKDYNGQTYWLSFNPVYMIIKESKIPKWINVSLGYGINNQLIGDGGTFITNQGGQQISFTPYRQYYLSLDLDWEKIPVDSKLLKLLFRGLNVVKLPFPALEFSKNGIKGHALYF
jgi:uncharacterized protein YfiM (DUF2279 family)